MQGNERSVVIKWDIKNSHRILIVIHVITTQCIVSFSLSNEVVGFLIFSAPLVSKVAWCVIRHVKHNGSYQMVFLILVSTYWQTQGEHSLWEISYQCMITIKCYLQTAKPSKRQWPCNCWRFGEQFGFRFRESSRNKSVAVNKKKKTRYLAINHLAAISLRVKGFC